MEKEFGKIKKNSMTDIVIRIDDFGGKPGLTIREFTTSEKYTGFTKSGTRISADAFKEFKTIIDSINENDFGVSAKEPQSSNSEKTEESEKSEISEDSEKKTKKKKKIQEELY